MTGPTERDRENAAARQEIADRQNAAYREAQLLALAALGEGWKPWMLISLIPSDHRQTGDTTAVATVLKAYRGDERLSENSMFVRRMPDGSIRTAAGHEELFGDLLHESHPTKTFDFKGQQIPAPRWELVWSSLEEYHPRSPAALAAARGRREEKAVEQMAEANPLFADQIRAGELTIKKKPKGRG